MVDSAASISALGLNLRPVSVVTCFAVCGEENLAAAAFAVDFAASAAFSARLNRASFAAPAIPAPAPNPMKMRSMLLGPEVSSPVLAGAVSPPLGISALAAFGAGARAAANALGFGFAGAAALGASLPPRSRYFFARA